MKGLRVVWKSAGDFFRDDGLMLSGSLSYFTMMALVPFCLFMIALFGSVLGRDPEFYAFFLARVANLFPSVTDEVGREIVKLVSYKGLGRFSLVLYGLLSYQVFASIEKSLNVIFKVKQKRRMLFSFIISIAVVSLMMVLSVLSFIAASLTPLLHELKPYFPWMRIGKLTAFIIRHILPFIMVIGAAVVLYVLIPKTPVRLSAAFAGALFTAVFFEIAKFGFSWYVESVAQYGKVYGSLTAVVLVLLWMFYSSCIFLVGAEIVHNLCGHRKIER